MLSKFRSLVISERGSVIALVAIGFTVLMGMVALVSDVGLLYLKQNKIAHAMDAAALAGAQELPDNPSQAVALAKEYAQLNGVNPDKTSVKVLDNNRSLAVSSEMDVDLIFARFLGKETGRVNAQAKAKVAPVKSMNGAVPFSVQDQNLNYGQEYVLKVGAGQWHDDPHSWFGALDYTGGGGGANEYREMVIEGYSGKIAVGDIIEIESGNMSGPTVQGVEERISSCNHFPKCTWDNYEPDCRRVIYIPVVKLIDERHVQVVGFGAFFLKAVEGHGNENNVIGYFVRDVISAEIDDGLGEYGLQGIKLTN